MVMVMTITTTVETIAMVGWLFKTTITLSWGCYRAVARQIKSKPPVVERERLLSLCNGEDSRTKQALCNVSYLNLERFFFNIFLHFHSDSVNQRCWLALLRFRMSPQWIESKILFSTVSLSSKHSIFHSSFVSLH